MSSRDRNLLSENLTLSHLDIEFCSVHSLKHDSGCGDFSLVGHLYDLKTNLNLLEKFSLPGLELDKYS